jgi:plastocyanin
MEMGRWSKLSAIGATLGLAVLLGGCGGETASGDVRPGPARQDAMRVIMKDEVFGPNVLKVSAGSPVTIEVRNFGEESHNLTIDDLDTSTGPMQTGDVMTVTFTAPRGMTEFRCTWHPDMVGRIVAT